MDLLAWIILTIVLFIVFEIFFFIYLKKKRRLPKKIVQQIQKHLQSIPHLSAREQIIEYDKLLDHCLKYRGLSGTLGEKMKRFRKSFVNENAIWSAHKLRNKIAHEVGYQPNQQEFQNSVASFRREIQKFITS